MPASLKLRLVVVSVLWVIVGVFMAGLILSAAFREHLIQQTQIDLAVDLDELHRVTVRGADGSISTSRPLSDPRYESPEGGHFWAVFGDGRLVAKSPFLPDALTEVPPSTAPVGTVNFRGQETAAALLLIAERGFSEPVKDMTYLVGSDRRGIELSMRRFNTTISWAMGFFAISMIVAAVFLLLYAMEPLSQVQTALADVRAGRTRRLAGRYPSEVRPLVDGLNAMMEDMGKTTQKARAQAGNLAHSLKTPLAVMTDEAYAIEKAGLKNSATVMFEQCRRMQRHIDYQLARTRSAAQRTMPGTSARAIDVVNGVTSALARLYSGTPVVVDNRIPADLVVACDFQDLNEIVANVLDNALKHARSRVVVSGGMVAGSGVWAASGAASGGTGPGAAEGSVSSGAEIVVEDDGPGLPAEAWDVVFDIGERWDSRAKGTGLGLPIVRDLVQLYGGQVALGRSDLGGLRIAILLPTLQV